MHEVAGSSDPTAAGRKVVLLVGAAQGIGKATALDILAKGHVLAACDKDLAGLEQLRGEVSESAELFTAPVDITRLDEIEAFARSVHATYSRVDVAICNAGGMISLVADGIVDANIRDFLSIPTDDWQAIIDLNLVGALNLSRAVLPIMVDQGHGKLILVSSASALVGSAGLSVYSAAKGGVIAFTKSLAREFASRGISVMSVAPGGIATRAFPATSASVAKRLERIAIGRMGEPEEIANVLTYLALDAPQYLTGEVISVAGGPA